MGMCGAVEGIAATDALIAEKMRMDQITERNVKKLLLLGTGNTGKSTFFRQFKMRFADGISEPEREIYRDTIRDQVIFYMRRLLELCLSKHNIEEESFVLSDAAYSLIVTHWTFDVYEQPELTPERAEQMKFLWTEEQIQHVYFHEIMRHELAVPASCAYFWNRICEIADPDFWPSDGDCINAYNRTSGITRLNYDFQNDSFEIVDIGGQRSERRKWIHVFDAVEALLYVVSLSAYDEILFEDKKTNAMTEQLTVFEETVNQHCFDRTTLIVFLNKSDLLQDKIEGGRPISLYFGDDYTGDDASFDESVRYIKKRFKKLNRAKNRDAFFHITCATNPDNATKVLGDVTRMIVGNSLKRQGFA